MMFFLGFITGGITLAALYAWKINDGYMLTKVGKRHTWVKRDMDGIWDVSELVGKK